MPAAQAPNTPFNLAVQWTLPGLQTTPHLAAIDLGTVQAPTTLGSAVLILTADPVGRLFADGFE
ncbi:MAG: hypothetical protein LW860_11955 [Xanthomonadaceae bacterium]|nr:hypothetical protein [Xanthomonadaceae bacterium]